MRSCCAVYVDVGYLLASAATYVTGSSLRRGVTVDYPALVARLVEAAESDCGMPLLRVNWYDSGARPSGMPDLQQDEIGQLSRVKLRLGRLSYSGEQKGVDVRIGLDLAIQGRNRVADVVYLVSGDDDLTEAVEEAQSHGVQVVLLAVPDHQGRPHGVSRHLRREVDAIVMIDEETIAATVRATAIPDVLLPEGAKGEEPSPDEPAGQTDPAGTTGDIDAVDPVVVSTPPPPAAEPGPDERGTAERATAEPSVAPATPIAAPATDDAPPRPAFSPAALAGRKATTLVLPGSSVTEDLPFDPEVGVTPDLVDLVAKQLVASWCTGSTPDQLTRLRAAAPAIPADLDRALLVDLASRAQGAHLSDEARQHLRDRFWVHVGRVRLG